MIFQNLRCFNYIQPTTATDNANANATFLKTLGELDEREHSNNSSAPPVEISWDYQSSNSALSDDTLKSYKSKLEQNFPPLNSFTPSFNDAPPTTSKTSTEKAYLTAAKQSEVSSNSSSTLEVISELTSENKESWKENKEI